MRKQFNQFSRLSTFRRSFQPLFTLCAHFMHADLCTCVLVKWACVCFTSFCHWSCWVPHSLTLTPLAGSVFVFVNEKCRSLHVVACWHLLFRIFLFHRHFLDFLLKVSNRFPLFKVAPNQLFQQLSSYRTLGFLIKMCFTYESRNKKKREE